VVDMLSVLDQWVETGKKPERIIGSRPAPKAKPTGTPGKPDAASGKPATAPKPAFTPPPALPPLTRPHCPWPQVAVYGGSGSMDDAANFVCRVK